MKVGTKRVFLSYRRDDSAAHAGWLAELMEKKGVGEVFLDVDAILLGEDFKRRITREIDRSDVVLVLIGRNWSTLPDDEGRPKIMDERDLVHLEVHAALGRGVPVVPILLDGARMPRLHELPESLRALVFCNGTGLRASRWDADVQALADALARLPVRGSAEAGALRTPARGNRPTARSPVTASGPHQPAPGAMGAAVRAVLATMPEHFQTKDLSETADFITAIGADGKEHKRHAWVGSYISKNREALGVESLGPSTNERGEHWRKVEGGPQPAGVAATRRVRQSRSAADDGSSTYPANITSSWTRREVPALDREQLLSLIAEVLRRGWSHTDVYERMLDDSPLKPPARIPRRVPLSWLASNVALLSPTKVDRLVAELRRRGWSELNIRSHVLDNRQPGLAEPSPARPSSAWIVKNAPLMTADEHDQLALALLDLGWTDARVLACAPYSGMPT